MQTTTRTLEPRAPSRLETTGVASATARPLRNIGISAHIDAGKTTLSERILFYAGKIHRIGEVHDASATMDILPIERERGITIQSAATQVEWAGHAINLIDTPGHVDFTVEVERALSVLDGAVLVLCGVAGVQAQTLTVDRQIRRHGLPRLVFINKLDRPGADALAVVADLRTRIDPRAVLINLPLYAPASGGERPRLAGVVDVITGEALRFDGTFGEFVRADMCPPEFLPTLRRARERLLEALADVDDAIMAAVLEDIEPSVEEIHAVLRKATIQGKLTPVLCGSAYHQVGVQPLLDAVVRYLPAPAERIRVAEAAEGGAPVVLDHGADGPLCAYAFKVDDGDYGQLTYVRVLQGRLVRGMRAVNVRTGERLRIGRLGRMHAATMEELESAEAGDIVVLFGVTCAHGDTLTDGELRCSLSPIVVPEPVMAVAIALRGGRERGGEARLAKALGRFRREDPSFKVRRDEESGETIIAGMGELHLDVYIDRLRREFGLEVEVSAPEVAYRESITRPADFNHTHKKQDGGHGQYARVQGQIRPTGGDDPLATGFSAEIRGGAIPREYLPACEQGLGDVLSKGPLVGAPVLGVTLELVDGATHDKDSSPLAFRIATRDAVRAALREAGPTILEPVMEVEVTAPAEFHGNVVGSLARRRGWIVSHTETAEGARIVAKVPLAEMFGYAGELRSLTQGQGCFSMSFASYEPVPGGLVRDLIERFGARAAR
jgi:elongation factor G